MKKILVFIFSLFLLVSCSSETIEKPDNATWSIQSEVSTGTVSENTSANEKNTNLNNNNTEMTDKQTNEQLAPVQNGDIVAVMKTNKWTIEIKLFKDIVPLTVNNFVWLAKSGYYNSTVFHRVINNFMIQWWDPTASGMWWESIYWAKFEDELSPKLSNIRWSISMANAGPNTNGSQFFINQVDNTGLDFDKEPLSSKHAVFGQVVKWMEVVDTIAKVKTATWDKPEKDIQIISLEVKVYQNWVLNDFDFDIEQAKKMRESMLQARKEQIKDKAIAAGDKVAFNYIGKFEDWTEFDNSYTRWAPIEFIVWAGQMIKWFDAWVVWMKIGDKKTLTLSPSEAYGEYNAENKQTIPKTELKSFTDAGVKLEVGEVLQTMQGNFKILEANEESVVVDVNHPMAGKTLIFDIEFVDFR